MKKKFDSCPNCHQNTLQFKTTIPDWKGHVESNFTSEAWYCTKCTCHIVSFKAKKAIDTSKPYNLEDIKRCLTS